MVTTITGVTIIATAAVDALATFGACHEDTTLGRTGQINHVAWAKILGANQGNASD
jgi:hypothetical protein